jgi:hypothetical protein
VTALVEQLWRDQSIWSRTANRMKSRIDTARWMALGLVVVVAACGTGASALATLAPVMGRVLAGIAAAGSAVLPLLRPLWSGDRLKNWTRARSVSEALKTEVYLWLARAGRYAEDDDGTLLRERTRALRTDAADLVSQQEGIEAEARPVPAVTDGRTYIDVRLAAQIDRYYVPRAARIVRILRRLRVVEVALGLIGAVLGVVAAASAISLAAWITVVATIGTALATHIAAARYEFQRVEFERTAEKLRQLREDADTLDADLAAIAVRAEDVISVENQGWMVKLAEPSPEQKASAPPKADDTG